MRYQLIGQLGDTKFTVVFTGLCECHRGDIALGLTRELTESFTVMIAPGSKTCRSRDSTASVVLQKLGCEDTDNMSIDDAYTWPSVTDNADVSEAECFTIRTVAVASARKTVTDATGLRPPRMPRRCG